VAGGEVGIGSPEVGESSFWSPGAFLTVALFSVAGDEAAGASISTSSLIKWFF